MEVIIKYRHKKNSDRDITLSVRPSDRILYIKAKIAEQLPLSIEGIKLSKGNALLSDDCTLSECHIDNHSIIELNKGFPISLTIILRSGSQEVGQYNVNTYTDYTVPELKNEIFNIIGIPAVHQKLIYYGELLCEKATLEDYHFPENSIIYLALCM